MDASTIVVPRFGCSMMSPAVTARTNITGRTVTALRAIRSARRARRSAAQRSTASFANSEGWMLRLP